MFYIRYCRLHIRQSRYFYAGGFLMSVHLKVLPAVLIDPDVLLATGIKICTLVRQALILDHYMEEICCAIDQEGRTLSEVLSRTRSAPFLAEQDQLEIACGKACSLLKTAVQLNLFQNDPERQDAAHLIQNVFDHLDKQSARQGYDISSDRIRDSIVNLESDQLKEAIATINCQHFFEQLVETYQRYETAQMQTSYLAHAEQIPSLRSTIGLYGMLIDTLIANVRFENYRLLHRVESVLMQIETVLIEATESATSSQNIAIHS